LIKVEARGKFLSKETYQANNCRSTVYWFEKGGYFHGKTLMNNVIALNRDELNNLYEDAKDYIFLHEYGNKSANIVFSFVFFPLMILSALSALLTLLIITLMPMYGLLTSNLGASLISIYAIFPVFFVYVSVFVLIKWADEALAEIFAFRKLGKQKSEEIIEEIEPDSRSLKEKVFHRFLYPPRKVLLEITF
jgi:hypothetical protein